MLDSRTGAEVEAVAPPRRRRVWTTPVRIRALAVAALLAALGLVAVAGVAVGTVTDSLHTIGQRTAPQVAAASDLYFALNDMDAQLANVLLVGDESGLGISRRQALDLYEQRRQQANRDLQRAATAAASDAAAQRSIGAVLDGLGRYQALAAQALFVDGESHHRAGQPPATALDRYRQATDLLKNELLPVARQLTADNARILDATYEARRADLYVEGLVVGGVGVLLVGVLVALQVFLARRFGRLVNPALVAATLVACLFTGWAVALVSGESEHLRVAKKDAFDSVLALGQARAVSYDANADESRYLVDPGRAGQYEQAFLARSQQLAGLAGAGLSDYDQALDGALGAYRARHDDVRFTGFFGTAFRNITFAGERAAAEDTLARYQRYQRDDRRIRALVAAGKTREAIALCTDYSPGGSNHDFDQYDQALAALIAINQAAFDTAIADGQRQARLWPAVLGGSGVAIVVLLLAGVRPRLAEYR